MRHVVFVFTTWLAMSAFGQSTERGSVAQMAEPQARLDMLVERLNLSAEQAAIAPILAEEGIKRRALMGGRTRSDVVSLEVGQMIPNLELVDDQGNPARLRELTRGHYTSMTLGCLT
jgi:hypothetical protein